MNTFKDIIKPTVKKIAKTGLFTIEEVKKDYLRYSDCHGCKYVLTAPDAIGIYFRIGYVQNWIEIKPTFESEYNSLGEVECSRFIDKVNIEHTDNPDFILRMSKNYLLNLFI